MIRWNAATMVSRANKAHDGIGGHLSTYASAASSRAEPVCGEGDADIVEVQRLMARNHIRSLPVVRGGVVIGIVDLLELAMMDEDLPGVDLTEPVTAE